MPHEAQSEIHLLLAPLHGGLKIEASEPSKLSASTSAKDCRKSVKLQGNSKSD